MNKDTLHALLKAANGLSITKSEVSVKEGFDVSVHVAMGGTSAVLPEVRSITLRDEHVEVAAGERRAFYVAYDHVFMVSVRAPHKEGEQKRAGFA